MKFNKKVRKLRSREIMSTYSSKLELFIDRKTLFSDAYDQIMNKEYYELKKRLCIKYIGEEGIDAGGLLR